jgi:hypothetical protein
MADKKGSKRAASANVLEEIRTEEIFQVSFEYKDNSDDKMCRCLLIEIVGRTSV